MPKSSRVVITDDLDGKELPDDTKPITLSLGRTTYAIYLSESNHGKLLKALEQYIENAESVSGTAPRGTGGGASSSDKEKMKKVRQWAQETGFKFKDAQGNEKTLGDRGRIPDEVVAAYDAAN